jgi:hypothetical protein
MVDHSRQIDKIDSRHTLKMSTVAVLETTVNKNTPCLLSTMSIVHCCGVLRDKYNRT